MAHGESQVRGPIRDVAAGLHHSHSNTGSEPHLWPAPQLKATLDLNPLCEVRDWTCVLMDASQIHFCWAMAGIHDTPSVSLLHGKRKDRGIQWWPPNTAVEISSFLPLQLSLFSCCSFCPGHTFLLYHISVRAFPYPSH